MGWPGERAGLSHLGSLTWIVSPELSWRNGNKTSLLFVAVQCRKCICAARCPLPDNWGSTRAGTEGCYQPYICRLCISSVSKDSMFVAAEQGPTLFRRLDRPPSEHTGNHHWILATWWVCRLCSDESSLDIQPLIDVGKSGEDFRENCVVNSGKNCDISIFLHKIMFCRQRLTTMWIDVSFRWHFAGNIYLYNLFHQFHQNIYHKYDCHLFCVTLLTVLHKL